MSNPRSNLTKKLRKKVERCKRDFIGDTRDLWIIGFTNQNLLVYGLALENNVQVTKLALSTCDEVTTDINDVKSMTPLLKFIETSPALERVSYSGEWNKHLLRTFLQAAAANSNIQEIRLFSGTALPEMIQVLLQNSKSVKKLIMDGHDNSIYDTPFYDAAVDLPSTFCQNQSLECLKLESGKVEENHFRTLAEAMKQSSSLKSIELESCSFDAASTHLLLGLVGIEQTNIQELGIQECEFKNYRDLTTFCLKVIQTRSPTAKVAKLSVSTIEVNVGVLLQPFQQYTESFSKTLFKCIKFDDVLPSDDDDGEIVSSLPFLRGLEELELVGYINTTSGIKEDGRRKNICLSSIEDGMRKNMCLKSLRVINDEDPREDKLITSDTIKMLGLRNEMIHQLRFEPHPTIPRKHMAQVLVTCIDYEFQHEVIFDLLKKHWILPSGKEEEVTAEEIRPVMKKIKHSV